MMKSFFVNSYQTFLRLAIMSLILVVVNRSFHGLNNRLLNFNTKITNDSIGTIVSLINNLEWITLIITFVILVILIIILFVELNDRFRNDQLMNFFISIGLTVHIRRVLKRGTDKDAENSKKIKYFNRSVKSSVADIRNNTILWRITLPADAQAIELIKSNLNTVREELTGRYPDFIYSKDNRQGKYVFIVGTKTGKLEGLAADRQAGALQNENSFL